MGEDESLPEAPNDEPEYQQSVVTTLESLRAEREAQGAIWEEKDNTQVAVAGFWRRVAAFIVDATLLSIPLLLMGFLFRDFAFALGPYGRFFGYALIIPYFGFFNSSLVNGQTIGKRILKIVTVDKDNSYLSLSKSLLRAFILGIIFMFNQWALPLLENPIMILIASVIVFGGIFSLLYAFVFNRTTRQGIHDLIAGSYVIQAPPRAGAALPEIPKVHRRIIYGLVGISLLLGFGALIFQPSNGPILGILEEWEWQELMELQRLLAENDEYFTVGVNQLNRSSFQSAEVLKDLNIELWAKTSCSSNQDYCFQLVMDTAQLAIDNYATIEELSGMRITVMNRFDFGLATGTSSVGASYTIEDWHKELEE